VASVENQLEELLNFFAVFKTHWVKARTANVIECSFREVLRCTRLMSSFTNPATCDRMVFGVISHLDRFWREKAIQAIST